MSKTDTLYQMIVFDAGGTLISANWPSVTRDLAAAAESFGLSVSGSAIFHGLREVWQEVILGKIKDQAHSPAAVTRFWHQTFAEALCRAIGMPTSRNDGTCDEHALKVAAAFYPAFEAGDYHCLLDHAPETLAALQAANYRLGLLSNWSPGLPRLLNKLNIDHYFEFIIVSSIVGLAKPDRAIFDLAVERAGCRPEQLLYVGDSPTADIEGSMAAGWDAVLVTHRHQGRYAQVDVPRQVETLLDLQQLLGVT